MGWSANLIERRAESIHFAAFDQALCVGSLHQRAYQFQQQRWGQRARRCMSSVENERSLWCCRPVSSTRTHWPATKKPCNFARHLFVAVIDHLKQYVAAFVDEKRWLLAKNGVYRRTVFLRPRIQPWAVYQDSPWRGRKSSLFPSRE